MLDIDYGYNPPFPESKDETVEQDGETSEKKNAGQRLLALVRLLEKKSNSDYDGYESSMQEIVDLFNTLIALYSRRGLLQGNNTKADRILSTLKSNQKERGQRKTSSRGDNKMTLLDGSNNTSDINNSTGYQQEYLVLTAIVRVLNSASVETSKNSILDDDQALLIALSSELCVAISQHILTSKESDNCINAEFELLMQSGKPILSGLVNSLRSIDFDLQRNTASFLSGNPSKITEKCLTLAIPDHEKHIDPINACLRAAASLIALFGTKLSRSVGLLSDLKSIAWKFLSMNEDSVQISAAKLIAIIPMAGGIDRKTPSAIWNESMQEVVSMLSTMTSTMAPLNKASSNDKQLSEEATARLKMWLQFVRNDISQESQRILTFHRFLRGLTLCFQSLLSRDGMNSNTSARLGDAKIDLESILAVVETFVSFPLSAETVFYKTKKRLRNEAVEGGLLSARAASTQIGNQIKRLGHGILDCLLESLGGSTLLPFASSITRISYASLVTSCSSPLRKVLDPSSAVQMDGKKRRWLHWSVPMRSTAINTLKVVLTLFGNYKSEKAGSSVASSSNAEKAIALVVGCYIEEMEISKDVNGVDTSWGTFYERSFLMVSALECLQAVLVSWGGFLAIQIRSMIDSMVLSGLSAIDDQTGTLVSCSSVKVALFNLAACCISTPWGDGSCSSIHHTLVEVARKHGVDMDAQVSMAAKAALRICESSSVPRAPALLYVSRAISQDPSLALQPDLSAVDLIKNIQNARKEISVAEKAHAEKTNEKKRKTRSAEKQHEAEKMQVKVSKQKLTVPEPIKEKNIDKKDTNTVELGTKKEDTETAMSPPGESHDEIDVVDDIVPTQASHKEEHISDADDNSSDNEIESSIHNERSEKVPLQEDECDNEDAFPDIMGDGGPDSDDE